MPILSQRVPEGRVEREARFHEDLGRHRRGVLDLAHPVVREGPDDRRGLGIDQALHVVAAVLRRAVVVGAQLVARADLPRHAQQGVLGVVLVHALVAIVGERVGDAVVGVVLAGRREEPELVLHDGTALADREVADVLGAVALGHTQRLQPVGQVVALPLAGAIVGRQAAAEPVAALARDHVERDAAARTVGADATGLVARLLDHRVVVVRLHLAVVLDAVLRHAVDHDAVLLRAQSVRGHVGLLRGAGAADIRQAEVDADDQLRQTLNRAARRQVVHGVAVHRLDVGRAGDVHHRRITGDRDGLFDGADLHLGVDGGGEVRGKDKAFIPDRLEAREREGHGISARPEVDHAVRARSVGRRDLRFLDERVARCLDRYAWQDRA